jgi:hypothetical protein
MQRLTKIAFVSAGCVASLCVAAHFILTIYLRMHRPQLAEGVFCYPLAGTGGVVFVTENERLLSSVLSNVGYASLFVALLLLISLKARR